MKGLGAGNLEGSGNPWVARVLAVLRHPGAAAGVALVGLVSLPAVLAPLLPLPDPVVTEPARRMLPAFSPGHLLGTDHLGRDLLSRLVWGTRSSIAVGALATLLAALVGSLIGLMAAWFGRFADAALMRGVDVLMAFPYLLLALAIVAALGPGLANAMLAIAVANVPFFARAVRGAALEIRHQDYIAAGRLAGFGEPRLLLVEVLPNLLPTILVLMTTTLGWMVLETAGLSFLGLGAQPPAADLGSMLGEGREFLTVYPRVAVLPGLLILLLVVGINLLGDALRDLIDPRWGAPSSRTGARAASSAGRASAAEPAAAADALLSVRGLRVGFPVSAGVADAVRGLDFDIARGERVALVGESGSGKTLTALALMRLLPGDARPRGLVQLDGQDLAALDEAGMRRLRGRRLAYVPQEPLTALDPLFRVGTQLDEALRAHGPIADLHGRGEKLLRQMGLGAIAGLRRRFPHELSGGQRQRIAIAMALAHGPDLLIADEATTALDVTVQQEILELLFKRCAEQQRALLFVSHDLALVSRICTRVLVMYAGSIVEDAPLLELLASPAHPYTAALLACSPELGQPDKPLPAIAGQPPRPAEMPPGCAFAPRCARMQPHCAAAMPALSTVVGSHRVRCLHPLREPA